MTGPRETRQESMNTAAETISGDGRIVPNPGLTDTPEESSYVTEKMLKDGQIFIISPLPLDLSFVRQCSTQEFRLLQNKNNMSLSDQN